MEIMFISKIIKTKINSNIQYNKVKYNKVKYNKVKYKKYGY